jgi:parallel beta-helix repeat protein
MYTDKSGRAGIFKWMGFHQWLLVVVLLLSAGPALASAPSRTITVPGTQSTIQAGIDAAYNGDTVLVAPGTYLENINFHGKGITVTSSGGPDLTVIDGNQAGAVVTFASGENLSAVLNGFSLRNGYNSNGGGIVINQTSPTITNNKISGNRADAWGGGIYLASASPLIKNNVINANNSSYGGGISVQYGGSPQILGNEISDNKASSSGGAIALWVPAAATIQGNTLKNNSAGNYGGGIWSGITQSTVTVLQNLIVNNKAGTGAGTYSTSAGDSYINNTMVNNDSIQGGSVYIPDALFVNNIVVGGSSPAAMYRSSSSLSKFSYNIVYSSSGAPYDTAGSPDQSGSNGNLSADPRLSNMQLGYYGLRVDSPAIDAGSAAALSLPATDFGGMPRIADGNGDGTATLDMGAYEFDPAPPVAVLQGIPADFLMADSLSLTVAGTGVASYRYALDGGAFSADIAVANPINLTDLANGQHLITVLGKNALGREQLLPYASAASWVVNTETSDLTFSFGGAAPWTVQALVSHDGIAYQSGPITENQSSWMETSVTGPGAISFWWKVSSLYPNPLSFSIDGTTQSSVAFAGDWQYVVSPIPAGSHTLRWAYSMYVAMAGLNAGWVDQISFRPGLNFDVTLPVTSATPPAGLYGSSQSVALSCSDTGSGCSGTFYCLGGSCTPSIPYRGPITIASATNLRYFSTDAAGNYESVKTESYSFDGTAPTTYPSLNAGSYSGPHDVTLYCSDSGMGCAATYYCLGSGCTPGTPYSSAVTISSSTDLRYYSVDKGGNSEAVKTLALTITPDTAPPVTTPNPRGGISRSTTVDLYCSDAAGSGCATTYYCLGSGCTPTTIFGGSLLLSASTELSFYSVDRSGNREAVSTSSYVIDDTPPATTPSVAGGIYATSQNVTLSCSDGAGSGCKFTYYCLGKGCSPYTQSPGPIAITSSTYLSYYSRDVAANVEAIKTERYTITAATPATFKVPENKPTIQAAIDAAGDGDTVLVAPGTYLENISFSGKAITVASSAGAELTVIDGNQLGPVVSFTSGEWQTSVLDGFTVRNGSTDYGNGGGIQISDASPIVRNNRIINNSACSGNGIYVYHGAPLVQGNLIAGNISQANCSGAGGGIFLGWAPGTRVIGNTITGNKVSYGDGAGIYSSGSGQILISGNIIRGNATAEYSSGCSYGGGIGMTNGTLPLIIQNLIADNHAGCGSGVYSDGSSTPSLANNSIVDNVNVKGSLVQVDGFSQMTNNLVFAAAGATPIRCPAATARNTPALSYLHNLVYAPSVNPYDGCGDQSGQNGNLSADPLLSSAAFGYYGLLAGSPAIDAGDNSPASLPSTDLDGSARLIDGTGTGLARVDIGAYEFDPDGVRASLSDAPAAVTKETSESFTVGGAGIVSYRYAVDGGAFGSAELPVATPITLSGLASGSHAVAVIGKSASREQLAGSATVSAWNIDATPPTTTATPAGGSYTTPQSVTLACSDGSGSGCAGTFYCLGGECSPDTPYTGPIAVNSPAGLRFYSRDAFGFQEAVKSASFNFTGTISGRVTDSASGGEVPYVIVIAYNAATGAQLGYGYVDGTGNYQIAGLAGGAYKVRFLANNYIEQWYSGMSNRATAAVVTLIAPGATSGIDAVLVKGGSITGSVTGKDTGLGLQNVYVAVCDAVTGYNVGSGLTDNSGAYSISGIPAGSYKLLFDRQSNSSYLSQWYSNKADLASATAVTVANASTTSGISVALQKGGSLTGQVTDGVTGAAAPGVNVVIYDAATGSYLASTATDAAGVYLFVGLSGSYKLNFSGTGYAPLWYGGKVDQALAAVVAVTPVSSITGINLAMVKGASISGTVTDSVSGAALSNVTVYAIDAVSGVWQNLGRTDGSGAYSITGLATGRYKLSFSCYGYVDQWSGGKADQAGAAILALTAPGALSGINVALVKGAVITGLVTDQVTGSGVQGITVTVYDAVTGSFAGSGYTDSSGVYSVTGLAGGSYKIQASGYSAFGYIAKWYGSHDQQSTADIVRVIAPNTVKGVDFALERGGAITGKVTDGATGAGLQGVWITVYSSVTDQTIGSSATDGAGNYTVSGLPTGSYKLAFYHDGYLSQWLGGKADSASSTAVSVSAPNATSGINMIMGHAGSVSGTITDRVTGVGIANSYLYLLDRESGEWGGSGYTDGNGAYTITGLASGSYRLNINPPTGSGYFERWYGDYPCADAVTVSAPNATTGIDAALEMGGSITGRATDAATGLGIGGVNIYLQSALGTTSVLTTSITSDANGAYTLGAVPSGSYYVTFNAFGYLQARSPNVVTVTAPEAVSGLDVTLVHGGGISGKVTDSNTGLGVGDVSVEAVGISTNSWVSAASDDSGNYLIMGLPSGSYALYYDARYAGRNYGGSVTVGAGITEASVQVADASALPVTLSLPDSPSPAPALPTPPLPVLTLPVSGPAPSPAHATPVASPVLVTAPAITSGVDFAITALGGIGGRVSDAASDEPLSGVNVTAFDSITGLSQGSASSNSDGSYLIGGVPNGSYRVQFSSTGFADGGHLAAWYGGGSASTVTQEVSVVAPATSFGIDARLARGGGISGTISANSCPGPQQVKIAAYDAAGGALVGQTWVDTYYANGFTIGALPAGSYKLAISDAEEGFVGQWYPGKTDESSAQPLAVTVGTVTGGVAVSLSKGGGSISGKVSSSGCSLLNGPVRLYDFYSGGFVAEAVFYSGGVYRLEGLPDASYKLLFTLNHLDRWYRTPKETAQASQVVVSGGAAVTGIDLTAVCQPDGSLDGGQPGLADALMALRMAVGIDAVTDAALAHYDLAPMVDGVSVPDGRIDIADALAILRKVVSAPVQQ